MTRRSVSRISIFCLAASGLFLSACQTKPTKVSVNRARPGFETVVAKAETPLKIGDLTLVLDVRSQFDYGLNHVLNSLHFPWSGLAEQESSGEVLRDPRKAILRMSLLGATQQTPIVIVGYGAAGRGEEGRLAWNLLLLGFRDVQTAAIESFRSQMTQSPTAPPQNVDVWKADYQPEMQIDKGEFLTLARDPKGRLAKKIHLLDVRSEKEYIGSKHPDFQALNVEWKQFFTNKGRPNQGLKARLLALGVRPEHRIVIVSNQGVRSAAASYALLALGFTRVQNFTIGWNSLSSL